MLLFLILLLFGPGLSSAIQIATIVPKDHHWLFSQERIAPAIQIALDTVRENGDLWNASFEVRYSDSECNSIKAPLAAFDFFRFDQAHVFLGPVCDYSLAPVARYSPYWDIPVISPGGMAHDFAVNKHNEYSMLTRVGWTFDSLARAVHSQMTLRGWKKVKLLYNPMARSDIVDRFCFLQMSALISHLKKTSIDFHLFIFHENRIKYEEMLQEEVGPNYASKF